MQDIIDVTAAVIVRDGRVLLVRRGPGERLAGWWEFPGGKMRPGETPRSCLERELGEELGLEASAGEVIAVREHAHDGRRIRLTAMHTEITRGDPVLTCHDRVEWALPEELERYRLLPADMTMVPEVRRLISRGESGPV